MEPWSESGWGRREMCADRTEDERTLSYRHMRRTVELSRQPVPRLRGQG
ncbi:hypothetical protein [Streptomyces fuscichromogenes]|uniref:Uncharacterized protein n=1 Tax=Streptomyces fuscichromogenes TaxID=1324013 RepID=A0A917UK70_9ACTN|nr:hypothetical protein [Streptomyces fuscichromogenes]GGM96238.1 hypothetical protein GCM10011578_016030 [Streptomyces fuscichromogenes]